MGVGTSPEGIVAQPGANRVLVATRNPPMLVTLNASSGRIEKRIATAGAARHLSSVGADGAVLVPEESADTLLEVRPGAAQPVSVKVGAHPHDAAAAAGLVFVGDEFGRAVTVLRGLSTVTVLKGFLQPGGLAACAHDIAVVDVRGNSLTLIDALTLRRIGRQPAGEGPTHVVSGSGGRLYVADTRGGSILGFSTARGLRSSTRTVLGGAPYGIAIDRRRGRLWVTLTARNELVELNVRRATPRVVAIFPTARQPNSVAVDERSGRVFVADAGEAAVELITP